MNRKELLYKIGLALKRNVRSKKLRKILSTYVGEHNLNDEEIQCVLRYIGSKSAGDRYYDSFGDKS